MPIKLFSARMYKSNAWIYLSIENLHMASQIWLNWIVWFIFFPAKTNELNWTYVDDVFFLFEIRLTLSWRRSLSYRNQSIDLQSKSVNWFLYLRGLHHERVNVCHRMLNHRLGKVATNRSSYPEVFHKRAGLQAIPL